MPLSKRQTDRKIVADMTVEERIRDIKDHPERHRHSFQSLRECSMVDGMLHVSIMEAHQGSVPQRNPGGCDVYEGPCSCGAWH